MNATLPGWLRLLRAGYAVLCGVLFVGAAYLYFLPCEGFECLGVAIGWMAWVLLWVLLLLLGVVVYHFTRRAGSPSLHWLRGLLGAQGVLGIVLLGVWLNFRFG